MTVPSDSQNEIRTAAPDPRCDSGLALVLSGGGARAAYQVGLLRHLGTRYPALAPGILTGVSAGAIIATDLALREGDFGACADQLYGGWHSLRMSDVFKVNSSNLASRVMKWGVRLVTGGVQGLPRPRSLVDTAPLRERLTQGLQPASDGTFPGIAKNLNAHRLDAVALTALSYTTGRSVTWVESRDMRGVLNKGPRHHGDTHCLSLDQVMASSALPFFFPACQVDGDWYGDGGVRLTAPLSPAVRLGARRILVVSTRHPGVRDGSAKGALEYPPPVQVAGMLLNAVFLDQLDADAERLQQINGLLDRIPSDRRDGYRHIQLLVIRPSQDLGQLADAFEPDLPKPLRYLVRGLGSKDTRHNDLLSLLMFQPDYIARLLELGEADARARADEIDAFLNPASS